MGEDRLLLFTWKRWAPLILKEEILLDFLPLSEALVCNARCLKLWVYGKRIVFLRTQCVVALFNSA